LLPDATVSSESLGLLAREVVREMTVKSGQKCTAIRRVLVPEALYDAAAEAIGGKLRGVTVGNPRSESRRMGWLVSRAQYESVQRSVQQLRTQTDVLYEGGSQALVDADPAIAACAQPTLLGTRTPDQTEIVHRVEVFGPVSTLMPYKGLDHALAL